MRIDRIWPLMGAVVAAIAFPAIAGATHNGFLEYSHAFTTTFGGSANFGCTSPAVYGCVVGQQTNSNPTSLSPTAGLYGSNSGNKANSFGVYGSASTGAGVYGASTGGNGVRGESANVSGVFGSSTNAAGVRGLAEGGGNGVLGESAGLNGVQGSSSSSGASGVYGFNDFGGWGVTGRSSTSVGVEGEVLSASPLVGSAGVKGIARGTVESYGVLGQHSGPAGLGVFGLNLNGIGVKGQSGSPDPLKPGVLGVSSATDGGGVGVRGEALQGTNSIGVVGRGSGNGMTGISQNSQASGVYGENLVGGYGTAGRTNGGTPGGTNTGVFGEVQSSSPQPGSVAVRGLNYGTGANGYGVYGSQAGSGIGVLGQASAGFGVLGYTGAPAGVGVLGYNAAGGFAGYFLGDVHVQGTLSKSAGSFKIDHPLDPAGKYLQHSFVESPEMMNVYNGIVRSDAKGFASVRLPSYFQALNRTFRYQLTIVGTRGWRARIVEEIEENHFRLQTDEPNVKVSWQVTGVRKDAYANAHRIETEIVKPAAEQGKYLAPELYGKTSSAAVLRAPLLAARGKGKMSAPRAGGSQ